MIAPSGERRIDFIVCGVQKAGTTTLDRLLRSHTSLVLGLKKEIHFFDLSPTDWARPDYAPYHAFFPDWDPAKKRGEVTPSYIFLPGVLERIRDYNPTIRLVAAFRNPIDRAFSGWRMERSRGAEPLSFAEAVREQGRKRLIESAQAARSYSYVERGFYGQQLKRLLALFPREAFLPLDFDELATDQRALLSRLLMHLGVAPMVGHPAIQALPGPPDKQLSEMGADDRRYLAELYADDVATFRKLSGLPLSGWTDWPI